MNKQKTEKDLVAISEEQGALSMLTAAVHHYDAILTGALGTKKLELLMIPGRLLQATRNNSFLQQLAKDFEDLRKKGKIKEDYKTTEQATSCLQELLAALENPTIDQIKFDCLKAIFLKASSEDISSRNDSSPQLLMSMARELGSGEILLLAAAYKRREDACPRNVSTWLSEIASDSALATTGMVEFNEKKLIEKKLVSDRIGAEKDVVGSSEHCRLTDFGLALCEFFNY